MNARVSGRAVVEVDPAYQAGHALIRLCGAAHFAGPVNFRLRREDYSEGVFGANGWQVADALLMPDAKSVDGDDLLLHIGPSIVQRIVNGVYQFSVPAAQIDTTILWPDDLPLLAGGASNIVAEPTRTTPRAAPAPRPQIQRAVPDQPEPRLEPTLRGIRDTPGATEPPVEQTLPPHPASTDQREPTNPLGPTPPEPHNPLPWRMLTLLFLLVALIACGSYFGYRRWYPPRPIVADQQHPVTPPSAPQSPGPTATDTTALSGPDLEHMTVIEALRSRAAPEALLREAQRRMQVGGAQRNDGLLLMQAAADHDYAPAQAALGQLYDPNLTHPPEIQPNPRQAALHYRAAVQGGDHSVDNARAALKSYLERQGPSDMSAPIILKDFWP